jgi:ribosomal protein S18 acetylase RimI-like enzyme
MIIESRQEIAVRPVGDSDVTALAALLSQSSGVSTSASQARTRLDRSRGVEHPFVAEVSGEVAGFASVRLIPYLGDDRPYAEISELFVNERLRKQGVGAALLAALETHARNAGAMGIAVITDKDNASALALYRSRGLEAFAIALQTWFSQQRPYKLSNQ